MLNSKSPVASQPEPSRGIELKHERDQYATSTSRSQPAANAAASSPPAPLLSQNHREGIDITHTRPPSSSSTVSPRDAPTQASRVHTVAPATHLTQNCNAPLLGLRPIPALAPSRQNVPLAPRIQAQMPLPPQPPAAPPSLYGPAPPPPSYISYNQPPVLMDRCPRCAYVPSNNLAHQPQPLPYAPDGVVMHQPPYPSPPPARPPTQREMLYPNLPAPPPGQPRPPSPLEDQEKRPGNPKPRSRAYVELPPEFRNSNYIAERVRPLAEALAREHRERLGQSAHDISLPDADHWLPERVNHGVRVPFIPLPIFAPVPSVEAIANTAPKWPADPAAVASVSQQSDNQGEGGTLLSKRDKAAMKRKQAPRLNRDQRRDILLMRRLGYAYTAIARFIGTTVTVAHYTCKRGTPDTNHKLSGRRVDIPTETINRMTEYVRNYQRQERLAGIDQKTGKRKMAQLTYNMIRDDVLKQPGSGVPLDKKFTDEALKNVLNKQGLFLRMPHTELSKELGRARGKKQWAETVARRRAEALRTAANGAGAEAGPESRGGAGTARASVNASTSRDGNLNGRGPGTNTITGHFVGGRGTNVGHQQGTIASGAMDVDGQARSDYAEQGGGYIDAGAQPDSDIERPDANMEELYSGTDSTDTDSDSDDEPLIDDDLDEDEEGIEFEEVDDDEEMDGDGAGYGGRDQDDDVDVSNLPIEGQLRRAMAASMR